MLKKSIVIALVASVTFGLTGCSASKPKTTKSLFVKKPAIKRHVPVQKAVDVPVVFEKRSPRRVVRPKYNPRRTIRRGRPAVASHSFANKLSNAALGRLRSRVRYDGSYVKIGYPWGDVPSNIGVCTDVVIRSYRKLGIDLQSEVHQDMSRAFSSYPNVRKWGLSRPDTNIDHRRVYNLRKFFARKGAALPISRNPTDYRPGDLVTWMVGPGLPHIGVVVNKRSHADPRRFMIVHNIANGPQMEDVLFRFPISGHYRYTTSHVNRRSQPVYASATRAKRKNAMSYNQLRAAANLLTTNTRKPQRNSAAAPQTYNKKSLQLATLTEEEVQRLLAH